MKNISIFKNRFQMILFCLFLVCGKSGLLQAQCNGQAIVYATSPNIPYCATGPCASQNINIDMGATCTTIPNPTVNDPTPFAVEVLGGIELVTPGSPIANIGIPTRAGSVFTIAVRAVAGSLCKGRVIFRYRSTADPCNTGASYPVANQVFVDVFKSGINATVLNPIYAGNPNLGGTFRIITETPGCISPSDIITVSVSPVFNGCLGAGIGLDVINWTAPAGFTLISASSDNSSRTYRAPVSVAASNPFSVFIGRANFNASISAHTVTLSGTIADNWISITPPTTLFTNIVSNASTRDGSACFPIDEGGITTISPPAGADQFILKSEINGAVYLWNNAPPGFLIVGSRTGQSITVIADNRTSATASGASGTFSCTASRSGSTCPGSTATFTINRSLVTGYNLITVTPAPTTNIPTLNPSNSGLNCFSPVSTVPYTFSISNAPLNTTFEWSNLANTSSFWNVISGGTTNGPAITVRPVRVGTTLASRNLELKVKTTNCSQQIAYQVNSLDPLIAGSDLAFTFEVLGDGVITLLGNGSKTWWQNVLPVPPAATCTGPTAARAGDYFMRWSFTGTDGTNTILTGDFFADGNPGSSADVTGNGLNVINTNSLLCSGTLSVTIETRPGTRFCPGANCFLATASETFINNTQFRKAVSGETAEESISKQVDGLRLSPNPSSGEVSVGLKGIEKGGSLRIMNGMQRTVQKSALFEGGSVLLKGLPAGIYTVEYISPNGKRFAEKLSVK